VRIDYDTWLRGAPVGPETCELVGYGPIAVSAVRDLVATGDPFVAAILTKGKALVGVAHLGRQPTAHQQSALEWLYPSCAAEGCPAQAHLQRDHRVDWAKTHYTVFDLLDLLCTHHHALKTVRAGNSSTAAANERSLPLTTRAIPGTIDHLHSRRPHEHMRRFPTGSRRLLPGLAQVTPARAGEQDEYLLIRSYVAAAGQLQQSSQAG
jgi:hypothetical protein